MLQYRFSLSLSVFAADATDTGAAAVAVFYKAF